MSDGKPITSSHSADVRMEVRVNGRVLSLTHLGRDFFVLDTPIDHPPTEADMLLAIDGHEDRWRVWLPQGISVSQRRTTIAPCRQRDASTSG
jgi:hypothetical protein